MIFWALFLSGLQVDARAATLFGHNLTPTTHTLPRGKAAVGSYALAYGISDELMLATSPWIILDYEMAMLDVRYSVKLPKVVDQIMFEQIFFKTFGTSETAYRQESTWTRLAATWNLGPRHSVHLALGLQYYFSDQQPFSMRTPSASENPFLGSISVLQEAHLNDHFGGFLELGTLAFHEPNPYFHYGVSFFYQWMTGMVQVGFSQTLPFNTSQIYSSKYLPDFLYYPTTQPYTSRIAKGVYGTQIAPLHPEIQFQLEI